MGYGRNHLSPLMVAGTRENNFTAEGKEKAIAETAKETKIP